MAGEGVSKLFVPCFMGTLREEGNKEAAGTESAVSDAEVMGSTRYVYLDENAGKTAVPFMSQPLERNFIGEEEDVQQEDVECNLQLDKMKTPAGSPGRP